MTGPLVVIGDTLLDCDLDGRSERVAPDSGAPVVEDVFERVRPGGAGLAALLAAADGAEVVLITPIGDDPDGRLLHRMLSRHLFVVPLPMRGTTVRKTRIRAGGATLTRVDSGDGVAAGLTEGAVAALGQAGTILVSDYGRGTADLVTGLLPALRRSTGTPVVWDPHPRGPLPPPGCTLVTPNLTETAAMTGAGEPATAAYRLLTMLDGEAVAITLGAGGAFFRSPEQAFPVPVVRPVTGGDTCGAGDRFAASAATGLLGGAVAAEAVRTATEAASRFVAGGGASSVRTGGADEGVNAFRLADRVRRSGGRVVATGGCFDLLHAGHVSLLRRARRLGDLLIVCLNSDLSVRRLKGAGRPVCGQSDRMAVLAALEDVDGVVIFDEDTPADAIRALRPHIWVKGSDYGGRELPESAVLAELGAESVLLETVPGRSTTRLITAARTTGVTA
ncbi:bifunctional heptose 7-phosphate kinase/heptose 1-phosphate adenyltransferase [Herbidospora galbida]|uniref:Bifunctional heptose 7-phosphate kinase/heptose 1-phosphate adenyltransferase n=1 Tax=Herbidospora galbida TaxID=2575442 RepID=A0A4U3MR57_9ACTN|nr:PfkB family carbohydrate kinase [Herbidospora galbida]TKK90827.1 bifunctional heptose 7-phosphate kinase/heptose 1-phosphate adenyltransferase [Herbidospora galbida]